jgi:hypothetical protein
MSGITSMNDVDNHVALAQKYAEKAQNHYEFDELESAVAAAAVAQAHAAIASAGATMFIDS